jgi:hypothetical protein
MRCAQARERARMMAATKRSRALAAQRIAAGQVVAKEDAARVIQAGIRGALWRRRVKREADQELIFIGMKPQVSHCITVTVTVVGDIVPTSASEPRAHEDMYFHCTQSLRSGSWAIAITRRACRQFQ